MKNIVIHSNNYLSFKDVLTIKIYTKNLFSNQAICIVIKYLLLYSLFEATLITLLYSTNFIAAREMKSK